MEIHELEIYLIGKFQKLDRENNENESKTIGYDAIKAGELRAQLSLLKNILAEINR